MLSYPHNPQESLAISKTAFDWSRECDYISNVTDKRGNVTEMNNDLATFMKYCEMQKARATREGYHDSAAYIQECLDDLLLHALGSK